MRVAPPAPEPALRAAPLAVAGAPDLRVHAALIVVQLVFGAFHVVARAVLAHLSPLAVAGLRLGFATPVLLILAWRRDRRLPARGDLPHLALLGLLGVFANQVLFLIGLSYTTATNAAILMPLTPVFAVALGVLLRIERVGLGRVAGILLAVAGALAILDPRRLSLADEHTLGNLLILTGCLAYAGFLVAQRPILARLPWRTVVAWAFLFGGAGVVAVAVPDLAALRAAAVPAGAWWGMVYIVLLPTVLAYSLSTWAVRRSSPSLVAAYSTLQPVVTGLLAAAFLGERLGASEVVGFAAIAAGLWITSRSLQGRPAAPPKEKAPR